MGTELTAALEKLAQMMTANAAGTPANGAAGGALVASQGDQVLKLELMPNDVKLNGVSNYLSWSRRALLILKTKGLMEYVLGTVGEPADKESSEWKKWSITDSLILAWMLNSLSPPIAASVEALPCSSAVWTLLSKRYSGKGNLMLMSQIEDKIHAVRQSDKSVMVYVNELQHFWAELDQCDPLELPHVESMEIARTWVERRRVMQFLKGLNQDFENRRAALLHQSTLVSLDEAIAAMSQEEVRLQSRGGAGNESAYRVADHHGSRECFNCGSPRHISRFCTEPPRRGRGRGYYGGNNNRGGRNGRGGYWNAAPWNAPRANVAAPAEVKQPTGGQEAATSYANFVDTNEGTNEHASIAVHKQKSEWVLDSGASQHVAGDFTEFTTYTPHTNSKTIYTADGTAQPITGVGTVTCTQSIKLSSVLHVPAFPVNLVSLSALVDQIDCRLIVDRFVFLIQERLTGRSLGTGVRRKGLWYMDRSLTEQEGMHMLAAVAENKETGAIIHHCRMGHVSFDKMYQVFPDVMRGVDKSKLHCDACEFAKHTRNSYVSKGIRSISPFMLIHSDVWTCPMLSVSGMKYFVTFIDCHSRMTWVYLMKHKDEVFQCFKTFYALVQTQFNVKIQSLRSDNGTEYVNKAIGAFMSKKGILHQTSCPDTPPQNGVAERKNRHLLEVARALMFTMNVPKFLWSEAIMMATFLINRTPSRVTGMKSPCELIFAENKFPVPPKVFGCTCFVRDHRPSVNKLDPRAVKCIFIGYSSGQKGYKCWSPSERRTFVSMDVTFRESEPFYGEKTDLSGMFDSLDQFYEDEVGQEGENSVPAPAYTGGVPPADTGGVQVSAPAHIGSVPGSIPRWTTEQEEQLKVYSRKRGNGVANQGEQLDQSPTEQQGSADVTSISSDEDQAEGRIDEEISLRRTTRANAGIPPERYGLNVNDIGNYVSYEALSPAYKAFVASLQSVSVPTDWKKAKEDSKWRMAMEEELEALCKNKTWVLTPLPAGKKAVSCKWVYTVKQNAEGKTERYKARLVARGYSQTYGIDYDETFAPVAKMNTVRILISCAANFEWSLHQLDVKNAFLHGDLQEEVYMEIPPGFSTSQTTGKVCRLKKALYGLKQSPRAWFDKFRRAVCSMGYGQCNGDHTLFYRHNKGKITILTVYVDDIIITGDDKEEIARLKECLGKAFEVKDLGRLKYFLGIEVARSAKGIVLSQRKYTLDLLSDVGMLGCRAAATPIDQNHKVTAQSGQLVEKERYQRLVGRLLYLCHTRPDIAFAVSVVSRYMHEPRSDHLEAVYRILRYLKGTPGKGLLFESNKHLVIDGYCDADWASCLDDRRSTSGFCVFVGGNLVSWRSKKQAVVSRSTAESEYRAMAQGLSEMLWTRNLLEELKILKTSCVNVWCDNKSAINIANNPVQHDRTKHVEIDRFFIKEKLDTGIIKIDHVSSGQQIADCLTKGLGPKECNLACDKMGMIDIYHPS